MRTEPLFAAMDVIRRAYADADEEDAATANNGTEERNHYDSLPPKRFRSDGPSHWDEPFPSSYSQHRPPYPTTSAPPLLPGRYISKRERAMMAAHKDHQVTDPAPPPPPPSGTSPGSVSVSGLPYDVLRLARCEGKDNREVRKCSGNVAVVLDSSTNAVNSLQWSQNHAHLLASAGMDHTVRVWNVWNREQKLARMFSYHNAAVKDVRWSPRGLSLLSCGYDCSSRLVDVEKGIETQVFREDQVVETIRFHPINPEIFLTCGSQGSLKLWDIRMGKVVKEYLKNLGPILDIEFSLDARYFISSSDISRSNASENAIVVWDVLRQIPLSNQVYTEAYTCPCIRYHPHDASFIAQSNGGYIAIFSSRPPFKLNKYKRYEKHAVSGFPIKCNFSLDGEEIVSGSADGCMYFYHHRTSELLRKIRAFDEPCVDVAFHPFIPNVVASCSWNGEISVFE